MSYTIWQHDVLLGRTDLEMPAPGPSARGGRIAIAPESGAAWERIRPTITELADISAELATPIDLSRDVVATDPEERDRQMTDAFLAHPGIVRLGAAYAAMNALGIELRDESGNRVPSESVTIQEVRPPEWISPEELERGAADARAEGFDVGFPMYIVVIRDADSPPVTP